MKIIHIMADGSIRDSIEGVVIESDQFYRVMQGILDKRKKARRETIKKTN